MDTANTDTKTPAFALPPLVITNLCITGIEIGIALAALTLFGFTSTLIRIFSIACILAGIYTPFRFMAKSQAAYITLAVYTSLFISASAIMLNASATMTIICGTISLIYAILVPIFIRKPKTGGYIPDTCKANKIYIISLAIVLIEILLLITGTVWAACIIGGFILPAATPAHDANTYLLRAIYSTSLTCTGLLILRCSMIPLIIIGCVIFIAHAVTPTLLSKV